jgi:hypothetical protein
MKTEYPWRCRSIRSHCGAARSTLLLVVAAFCVAGAIVLMWPKAPAPPPPPADDAALNEVEEVTNEPAPIAAGPRSAAPRARPASSAPPAPVVAAPAPYAEPTLESRQLVASLSKLDLDGGVLTPEQAANWRTKLASHGQLGSSGIPASRQFLDKNLDFEFGSAGRQMLVTARPGSDCSMRWRRSAVLKP